MCHSHSPKTLSAAAVRAMVVPSQIFQLISASSSNMFALQMDWQGISVHPHFSVILRDCERPTAMSVAGRKIRVTMAMTFIVPLSWAAKVATRTESSATRRFTLLSFCAMRLKLCRELVPRHSCTHPK
jgi:hypothetical protein